MTNSSDRTRHLKNGVFNGNSVLYWMVRDKRVNDNWALLEAQKIALKNNVPLIVCFNYYNKYSQANIRHYQFLFDGLKEVQSSLIKLNIQFHLLQGKSDKAIPKFIDKYKVGHLVVDFSPLRVYKNRLNKVLQKTAIPVSQVDAHNIVPVWQASEKKEFAAYTIRPKIKRLLPDYLTDMPKVIKHPYILDVTQNKINWDNALNSLGP